jgi:hypothetical protein
MVLAVGIPSALNRPGRAENGFWRWRTNWSLGVWVGSKVGQVVDNSLAHGPSAEIAGHGYLKWPPQVGTVSSTIGAGLHLTLRSIAMTGRWYERTVSSNEGSERLR